MKISDKIKKSIDKFEKNIIHQQKIISDKIKKSIDEYVNNLTKQQRIIFTIIFIALLLFMIFISINIVNNKIECNIIDGVLIKDHGKTLCVNLTDYNTRNDIKYNFNSTVNLTSEEFPW